MVSIAMGRRIIVAVVVRLAPKKSVVRGTRIPR